MAMRVLLVTFALCAVAEAQSVADRFLDQERTAFEHYNRKAYAEAIAAFEKQIAIFASNPRPYYNVACCYALQGKAERAATWLRLAIAHDWRDLGHLERDPDFDGVRESEAYRVCVDLLRQIRRRNPDPLPRPLAPATVPAAPSAQSILVAAAIREQALAAERDLLEEHQLRQRLFAILDRQFGALTRYLAENGDARDAAAAAHARVQTAMRYLAQADEDSADDQPLRAAAARLVLIASEDFLRGWAGSPYLPDVLYWRGFALSMAGRGGEARAQWRTVAADHAGGEAAGRALADLCALEARAGNRKELARYYAALERDYPGTLRRMRPRLMRARLMVKGVPEELDALATGFEGATIYAFVSTSNIESEKRLSTLRRLAGVAQKSELRVFVLCLDEPSESVGRWLEEHASGLKTQPGAELARAVWLNRVPLLIVARRGKLVGLDPDDKELARLLLE